MDKLKFKDTDTLLLLLPKEDSKDITKILYS